MKQVVLLSFAALAAALVGCTRWTDSTPSGQGAVATGHYRDLFVEAGHSRQEVTSKLNEAFQQLFHGNPTNQTVYFSAGENTNGPMAFILDVLNNDVRSEGMSYGMMVAVQFNKRREFDALWNWSRTRMYHSSPDHPAYGYFSWSLHTNGVAMDEMPAPDGEEYFATALYFASGRWGNGAGIYDYRAEADRLVGAMRHRDVISGLTRNGPKSAGALFDEARHLVRFTPDVPNRDHTDPSYVTPAFYEFWATCGPAADRTFWRQAALAGREFFQRSAQTQTGLAPEYANFDGTPWIASWNRDSGRFAFDAWRAAMNWSVDWAWWAEDPREPERSDRIQAFFESKNLARYGNEFTLDGNPLDADHSPGLVAMNAVASLAAAQPRAQRFVDALWATPVPEGRTRYYDGLLYLLGLLHCSGEFRVWWPR